MEIRLYQNMSEAERATKTLQNELILNGEANTDLSLLHPTFILELDNLPNYNYIYVPEFGRYYFIGEPINIGGNTWQVPCEEDYLSSWWNSVKENTAVIARQEQKYNLYLNDPEWKVYTNKQVLTRDFPSGFLDSGNYFLTVVGGYDDVTEGSGV